MADQTIQVGTGYDAATLADVNVLVTAGVGDALTITFMSQVGGHTNAAEWSPPAGPDTVLVNVEAGYEHKGVIGSQPTTVIKATANHRMVECQRAGVTFEDIEIDYDGFGVVTNSGVMRCDTGGNVLTLTRCIIHNVSHTANCYVVHGNAGGNVFLNRCIITNIEVTAGSGSFLIAASAAGGASVLRCRNTIIYDLRGFSGSNGQLTGINDGSGAAHSQNCIVWGLNLNNGGGIATCYDSPDTLTTCIAEDASGTIQPTAITDVWDDVATSFRPASGGDAIDAGTDISGDDASYGTAATDIAAMAESGTWEIGAFRFVDFYDSFTGTADIPIYDRDPDEGLRWQRY